MATTHAEQHHQLYSASSFIAGCRIFLRLFPYLLILGLVIFCWVWLKDPATLPIKNVKVHGEFMHINKADAQVLILPYVTKGFFNVDVNTLKELFLEKPWVESITISRVWPDTVSVRIAEKQAIAVWNGSGLFTHTGALFTPDDKNIPTGLPRFYGPQGESQLVFSQFQKMEQFVKKPGQITEIHLSNRHSWQIRLQQGVIIELGTENVLKKLQHFVDVYPDLVQNNARHLVSADLRYDRGMALKWE